MIRDLHNNNFIQTEVKYLGYIISQSAIQIHPGKTIQSDTAQLCALFAVAKYHRSSPTTILSYREQKKYLFELHFGKMLL